MSQTKTKNQPSHISSPQPYSGFDGQYIAGAWRPGGNGSKLPDIDPYSGEVLAEIVQANKSDLDEAYRAAAKAQPKWAAASPTERAAVMLRSAVTWATTRSSFFTSEHPKATKPKALFF
ncbi:MAG TPA: aldehyde dehydrogenase family protein [Verrucomicrobiae bacterium]|jgi:aldehyde dehydrogenase (NAD+)|nr:aldehyde dehydrogenase family protein [Verrucomicrobiae bacterium]